VTRLLAILLLLACRPDPPASASTLEEARGATAGPTSRPAPLAAPGPATAAKAATPGPRLLVDLHVDTVTAMEDRDLPWGHASLEAGLPALREGGVNVVVEAAWIPRGDPDPRGTAIRKLTRIRRMVEDSGVARVVLSPADLERTVSDGRIAVVLGLEGGTALVDGERTLDELDALGLRVVGLTWTESSPYADSSAEPRSPSGLTPAGREMIGAIARRGLILDVSHMSDAATAEAVARSPSPVLASHSNLRRACDVPRNLPDALARGIAERGGMVGVMFHAPFLRCPGTPTRADAVTQVRLLLAQAGPRAVGIGSDWDGRIRAPGGLASARDLPAFLDDLRAAGIDADTVDAVAGRAFLEFWRRVEAVAAGSPPRAGSGYHAPP
jgi:membrane dipeptidase